MTNHVDLAHFFEFKQTKCVNRLRIIFGLMANNDFNNAAVVSCCVTQTCIVLFWHCIFLRRDPIYFPSFRNSLYEQKHKQRSRDCQIRRLSNRCLSIFFKKKNNISSNHQAKCGKSRRPFYLSNVPPQSRIINHDIVVFSMKLSYENWHTKIII